MHAAISGVLPILSARVGSTPSLKSSRRMSTEPPTAAWYKLVAPLLLLACGSAPARRRSCAMLL